MRFLACPHRAICTLWHVLFWLHYAVTHCYTVIYKSGTPPAMSLMSSAPSPPCAWSVAGGRPWRARCPDHPRSRDGHNGSGIRRGDGATLDAQAALRTPPERPRPWRRCQSRQAKRICCTTKLVLDMWSGVCYTLVQVRKDSARGSSRADSGSPYPGEYQVVHPPARAGRGQ